ncbi:hypothetical protein M2371_001920 [Buttiauxella sp. BIGb0471]|uniref:replication protein n=1 Tax=Buttiauxella sp. BIGb0471 TaxID=2940597 RepID=UPI002169AB04|nr:replication protein [Buttiauxella sp. BIGb0471]MCS3602711.1 hypothetical protein [Buttiauxella sp. BIGb0471]
MENQKNGYIPLYRSIKKKPWAKDVFLRTLWENLLIDAQRQPYAARFKGHVWHLQPGQLVVTAADLGLALCDRKGKPTSRDAVERMLGFFVREGMISMEGEKQKGRVITILNYAQYAEKVSNLPAQTSAHTSAHDEASAVAASEGMGAHGAAQTSAQHEQEDNNNTKKPTSENSDESSDERLKKFLSSHPEAVIYTPNGSKWGSAEDLRAAEWISALVNTIKPTARQANLTAWANDIRLMRVLDGRTHREVCELFKWVSKDAFWSINVLCPAKLREKWDTLSLKRDAARRGPATTNALDFDNTDWAEDMKL